MLRFTRSHEWIRLEADGTATVGITPHAVELLGDLVFVEANSGATVKAGEQAGVVESVKAASEVYAPVSGEILAFNDALSDDPSLVNQDPTGKGWLYTMRPGDPAELDQLLDDAAYAAHAAS